MVEVNKNARERQEPLMPVCAIGASAGGVRALQRFFEHVDDGLGLTYVVIVHRAARLINVSSCWARAA